MEYATHNIQTTPNYCIHYLRHHHHHNLPLLRWFWLLPYRDEWRWRRRTNIITLRDHEGPINAPIMAGQLLLLLKLSLRFVAKVVGDGVGGRGKVCQIVMM